LSFSVFVMGFGGAELVQSPPARPGDETSHARIDQ
jgi:hypothetical protein